MDEFRLKEIWHFYTFSIVFISGIDHISAGIGTERDNVSQSACSYSHHEYSVHLLHQRRKLCLPLELPFQMRKWWHIGGNERGSVDWRTTMRCHGVRDAGSFRNGSETGGRFRRNDASGISRRTNEYAQVKFSFVEVGVLPIISPLEMTIVNVLNWTDH